MEPPLIIRFVFGKGMREEICRKTEERQKKKKNEKIELYSPFYTHF